MIVAAPPPCAASPPQTMNVQEAAQFSSPDCKWKVTLNGAEVSVTDARTGAVVSQFVMDRSASLHWLDDGRYLLVNFFAGSGSTLPMLIILQPGPEKPAIDLAGLIWPSVLKHAGINDARPYGDNAWAYHYYVNYVGDSGGRLTVSAETWFTPGGQEGPASVKCYVYSISKASLRYRFVSEIDLSGDANACPHNPDETWN